MIREMVNFFCDPIDDLLPGGMISPNLPSLVALEKKKSQATKPKLKTSNAAPLPRDCTPPPKHFGENASGRQQKKLEERADVKDPLQFTTRATEMTHDKKYTAKGLTSLSRTHNVF